MENPNADKTIKIINEVYQEIDRAEGKHGNQDHLPSLDQTIITRRDHVRMCEEYGIITQHRAKTNCDTAFKRGELTHAHILIEEVSEAICCMEDEEEMRKELIQVAAMAVNWVRAIDSKKK